MQRSWKSLIASDIHAGHLPVFAGGDDHGHLFHMRDHGLHLPGLQGFRDAGHHVGLGIRGVLTAAAFAEVRKLGGHIPRGHSCDGGRFHLDLALTIRTVALGADGLENGYAIGRLCGGDGWMHGINGVHGFGWRRVSSVRNGSTEPKNQEREWLADEIHGRKNCVSCTRVTTMLLVWCWAALFAKIRAPQRKSGVCLRHSRACAFLRSCLRCRKTSSNSPRPSCASRR
jgi:hypothetical protein